MSSRPRDPKAITILIADDHQLMQDGLRGLIERNAELRVVAQAKSGIEAVSMALERRPDVAILDVTMPGLNGFDATRRIVAELPGTKVIILSMHSDPRFVREALKAGAKGYILKEDTFVELSEAIRAVCAGQIVLSSVLNTQMLEELTDRLRTGPEDEGQVLSPREREVLQSIAEGLSTKEIAALLSVSLKTVETHRAHMMEKLGLHSVAELTKYAIRAGLTSVER